MDENEDSVSAAISRHFDYLQGIFPNANCTVLISKCREIGDDEDVFQSFINDLFEDSSSLYVTPPEDLHPLPSDDVFDVEAFLNLICTKDPLGYFQALTRNEVHKTQMLIYLKNKFLSYAEFDIEAALVRKNYNLLHALDDLVDNPPSPLLTERKEEDLPTPLSPHLINEIKFVENFPSIKSFTSLREEMRLAAQAEERCLQCECCYADDLIEDEVKSCTEGHVFCYSCVKKYIEVKLGEAQIKFPCMQTCQGSISMSVIKEFLTPRAFSKLNSKIQEAEVKAANIPGLEYCPSCEYGVIPAVNDPLFYCKNCSLKICRACKNPDHAPLKCGETLQEYMETKNRVRNEEQATNQILRKCGKCNQSYIKISGCNVITCPCGTKLCYICSAVLTMLRDPYSHSLVQLIAELALWRSVILSDEGIFGEKIYTKLCNKNQEAELKMANISGLEFCSKCEYGYILDKDDPYFDCLMCKVKTCRLCRKEYHAPLNCDENDSENKAKMERIAKEEEATGQVVRMCLTCNSRYIKIDGCNTVMCTMCNTTLCYSCSAVIGKNLPVHESHSHICRQL